MAAMVGPANWSVPLQVSCPAPLSLSGPMLPVMSATSIRSLEPAATETW